MLWDLNEGKHLYTLDHTDIINALCFSPNRYWLCVATGPSIKIWVIFLFYIYITAAKFDILKIVLHFIHIYIDVHYV